MKNKDKNIKKLVGWIRLNDGYDSMRAVEFSYNKKDRYPFSASLDGEIWDYSEEPSEFSHMIMDDVVYTKIDVGAVLHSIVYEDPVSYSKWLEECEI